MSDFEYGYAGIRALKGGYVVSTEDGEEIFTSLQKAIAAVKAAVAPKEEKDE